MQGEEDDVEPAALQGRDEVAVDVEARDVVAAVAQRVGDPATGAQAHLAFERQAAREDGDGARHLGS